MLTIYVLKLEYFVIIMILETDIIIYPREFFKLIFFYELPIKTLDIIVISWGIFRNNACYEQNIIFNMISIKNRVNVFLNI